MVTVYVAGWATKFLVLALMLALKTISAWGFVLQGG